METTAPNGQDNPTTGSDRDVSVKAPSQALSSQMREGGGNGQSASGRLAASTADKLHRAASSLRERATGDGRMTRLAGGAATAVDQAADYVDRASLRTIGSDLGGVIRRFPLQSLAIGFGAGFLAARALRR